MLPYAAPFAAKANRVLSSDWEQVRTESDCHELWMQLLVQTGCRASSSTLAYACKIQLLMLTSVCYTCNGDQCLTEPLQLGAM
jgi:hypothetical protein